MPTLTKTGSPPGSISSFGGTSAPNGFLICDGSSLVRTVFPKLFAAIGTAYGAADGTHFNIPDFRGMFIRGYAAGSANDPDRAARTISNPGSNSGDNVGSLQLSAVGAHSHSYTSPQNPGNNAQSGTQVAGGGSTGSTTGTASPVGGDTRPNNISANFIIKY